MMLGPELGSWILALALTIYGVIFLIEHHHSREDQKGGPILKTKSSVFQPKNILLMFAIFYFVLAHFNIYGAILSNMEYGQTPECENLLNQTNLSAGVTTHTYYNSCDLLQQSDVARSNFVLWSILLGAEIFALFIGSMMLFFRWLLRW